jgi:ABC-2 type transport system ATP-binding protein
MNACHDDKNSKQIASINDVCKTFDGSMVLSDINLQLHQGEVLTILGPNGAGKTTLINTLLGRLSLTRGEISIFGHPPGSMAVKRKTGAMLQVSGLPEMSTIKEHITLFQSYYAQPMDYEQVMVFSGLKSIENQYSKNLSGGQKQRLLFALAICGNPSILFLDEPTVGMDITARKSLWDAIETLKAQGTSILLTTHYLEEADHLSDRIVILNDGKIIREGSPTEIKSQINTKKISFNSTADITTLCALSAVIKVATLSSSSSTNSGTVQRYELESSSVETTLKDIFDKQLYIDDLTIKGAALEDAFELINNDHTPVNTPASAPAETTR